MAAPKLHILIVDDQPAVRDAFRILFEVHDLPCVLAASAAEALARVRAGGIGVVIQDMNFSPGHTEGDEGADLFRRLKSADPGLPVLLITAWASLETAVQLVKEGASDYLAKPWNDRKLLATVRELLALREDLQAFSASASGHDLCGLVFASEAMKRVVSLALSVADSAAPILITGPNGSGKEGLADVLHANSSRRRGPCVKVNVGALPIELMEAELFGAEAGAYTGRTSLRLGRFEAAAGGTLFLDEIDSLSLAGQVKLLRVLESGEFSRLGSNTTRRADVRIISATNADLERALADGRFREDLYFRINVVELAVPSLSERPADIPPLAEHFLRQAEAATGKAPRALASASLEALIAYAWPGNVRELRNRIERASLLAAGREITPADLDLPAAATADSEETVELTPERLIERRRVERVLIETGGVVARAAEELGISRQALYRKMSRLGIVLERRPG